MTRKLVANLFSSVDGVAADPYLFQYDSFDDDLAQLMGSGIARITDNVLGRVTYQEWAAHWPAHTDGPDAGFAEFINGTPKHVVSTTLTADDLTWAGSRLVGDDLLGYVHELKAGSGGDIAVQGSLSVVRQLVESGLMDELTLIVHPAVAGTGRRLFDDARPTRLTLLDLRRTEKGNVLVTYGPHAG